MTHPGLAALLSASLVILLVGPSCSSDEAPVRNSEEAKLVKDLADGKSVDLFAFQGGGVENVCFSGGYQEPIRDIHYELKRDFASCSGTISSSREEYLGAISFIWRDRCHAIDVPSHEFLVELQNGTSCYGKDQAKDFELKKIDQGEILLPVD